jgi:hypothetical protein
LDLAAVKLRLLAGGEVAILVDAIAIDEVRQS